MKFRIDTKQYNKNIIIGFNIILFFIILLRFLDLQVLKNSFYIVQSNNNSIRAKTLFSPRGIIVDRHNRVIVDNQPIYSMSIVPSEVNYAFNYSYFYEITGIDSIYLINKIKILRKERTNRFRPFQLKSHLKFNEKSLIEESKLEFPGIIFNNLPARYYPNNMNLSHVVGYLREIDSELDISLKEGYAYRDIIGFTGLEKVYEDILKGKNGLEYHLVDIYGVNHGLFQDIEPIRPESGNLLKITVDMDIQNFIEQKLYNKVGTIIVMNPGTGEVLGLASSPDYNLKSFIGPVSLDQWKDWNNDNSNPLVNRAIQGLYPPGSIFKIILAIMALEDDAIDDKLIVNCKGDYTLGDRTFHCWHEIGHGNMNLRQAIINSCNIYFYKLVQQIKLDKLHEASLLFGFNNLTNIDLLSEKKGLIPSKKYMNKKYGKYDWSMGHLLNFSIGQGEIAVTPIQVINLINIIANKGYQIQPFFNIDNNREVHKIDFKINTWDTIIDYLGAVVNDKKGTGKNAKCKNFTSFGKTGTAQNPHGEDHAWFSGFAVLESQDTLSLVVLIEHGGKGSEVAAKISRDIFKFCNKQGI